MNEELTLTPVVPLELDYFDCRILICSLNKSCKETECTLQIIERAQKSKISLQDRKNLPENLQWLSNADLIEQLDSFKTLLTQQNHLIDRLTTAAAKIRPSRRHK